MSRRKLATHSLDLALAAPAVIALRTARMLAAGNAPSAADRREASRMVTEKVDAFSRSAWAMAAQQQQAALGLSLAFARAWWSAWLTPWNPGGFARPSARRNFHALGRQLQHAQVAALARGLAPLRTTATSNLRRLSRRSR
jgi:hypothetical protein